MREVVFPNQEERDMVYQAYEGGYLNDITCHPDFGTQCHYIIKAAQMSTNSQSHPSRTLPFQVVPV